MAAHPKAKPSARDANKDYAKREKAKIAAKDYRDRAKVKQQKYEKTIAMRRILRRYIAIASKY